MGETIRGLACCVVVCLVMAGCAKSTTMAGFSTGTVRPAAGHEDGGRDSVPHTDAVCLLDLSAMARQEAARHSDAPSG